MNVFLNCNIFFRIQLANIVQPSLAKCLSLFFLPICVSSSPMSSLFRTPWKRCCFSGDGEYIVAGSARQHALYIWEKSIGNLVKILHGTRGELLLDVAVRMRIGLKLWLNRKQSRNYYVDTTSLMYSVFWLYSD